MKSIEEIYKLLDPKSTSDDQLLGIRLARESDELSHYIMPCIGRGSKDIWKTCARALYEIPDERLMKYLPALLEWLEDLNWPGAYAILDRLLIFSGEKLKEPFIEHFDRIANSDDINKTNYLGYLSLLLDNDGLKALLPESVIEMLQSYRS